jgi:lysophospholipase L1-like esterase
MKPTHLILFLLSLTAQIRAGVPEPTLANSADVAAAQAAAEATAAADATAKADAAEAAAIAAAASDANAKVAAAKILPGTYADDLAALRAGVPAFSAYRLASGQAVVWRDHVRESIAFMGDSITSQGFTGLYSYDADGYMTWARQLNAAQWDAEPNGANLSFASGGYTTLQIQSTHLPQVLASNATRCVVQGGINDFSAGRTSAQAATTLREIWASLTAAGITPIATTVLPDAANVSRQAWIAATNVLIRAHAAADNVVLCDWSSAVETSPGVGSIDDFPDNIHPNQRGCVKLARVLADTVATLDLDPLENYSASDVWLTANNQLSGSSGQPTDWASPSAVSGATINSKSLVSSAEGNWWRLDYSNGSATTLTGLTNLAANLDTVVGKTVEGVMELQVISGSLTAIRLRVVTTGGTQESYDGQGVGLTTESIITPDDGIVVLRTPKTVVSAGTTLVWPQIVFGGTAVFQIRRAGVRDVTP